MSASVAKIAAVIPARMNSSRFPGKPLALLAGRAMLEHIVRRAELCGILDAIYVATPDEEIRRAVETFGGKTIMTAATHQRASDRVAEAAVGLNAEIIVMIQGDEPMITPEMIEQAAAPLLVDSSVKLTNLTARIRSEAEYLDRNTIKVVMNQRREALYFSRAPIPPLDFAAHNRAPVFKQVCVIAFRKNFLREFAALPGGALEQAESIDMLRALEHGAPVRMVETEVYTHAVDTPADLRAVELMMRDDALIAHYKTSPGEISR